jgi:SAM-dependent methyltransferase
MNTKEYRKPYDAEYAEKYNEIWIENQTWAPEAKHHIDTLKDLISAETKWLDSGCGTGFFLSKFPGISRAGFDLSESMLKQAKKANPDALFFREANLVTQIPEWNNQWDLVTCTGQPWTYLSTIAEIAQVVKNISGYVNENGKCLLTFFDLTDFTHNAIPIFNRESEIPDDQPYINGVIWNTRDNGVSHEDMILPNMDQWIRWFSNYFTKIEILRWPHDPPHLRIPRRTLLCSNKRTAGDLSEAVIIEHSEYPREGHSITQFKMTDLPVSYFIERFKPFTLNFWKKAIKIALKR